MNPRNIRTAIALIAFTVVADLSAQVPVSVGVYHQNFGSLAASGTANPWADNTTLPGWFAAKTSNGVNVTTYRASTGSDNAGALYSFGTNSAERALGSIGSGSVGDIAYAIMFTNDTGQAQGDITISYTGEQWRSAANTSPHQLYVDYQISPAAPVLDATFGGAWLPFQALDFHGPSSGSSVIILDGNQPANQQSFTAVPLGGEVLLQAGEVLTLRWLDLNDPGNDHGLAIDDLTVTFPWVTPEVDPPLITAQPQSRTNNAGTSASFSVTVSGTEPLAYRWRRNGIDLTDGGKFVGSANPTLTVGPLVKADEATFDVVITNVVNAVTSVVATLTVLDPAINAHPFSRTNVPGDLVTFSVSAAGTGTLNYQWLHDGIDIPAEDNTTYQITNLTEAHQGAYSVRVSNSQGTVTSSNAFLDVIDIPSIRFAQWDFNNTNAPATTNQPAIALGSGSATVIGNTIGAFVSGTSSDPGSLPDQTNSAWNTSAYPAQGAMNKEAGAEFRVSTVGYQQLFITWQQRNSGTASRYVRLQYSANGVDFVDQNVYTVPQDSVFFQFTSDLSSIDGVANNPDFAFRIVSEWESTATGSGTDVFRPTFTGGSYNPNGTIRFDMLNIFGEPAGGRPNIMSIDLAGANVIIDFTGDSSLPATAFILESSQTVDGVFADASASILALGGGTFRATVAASGAQQFYRIRQ